MEAYPPLVRRRIVELYQQGMETWEIARLFGTCESGTRRVWQVYRESGSHELPPGARPGRKPRFDAATLSGFGLKLSVTTTSRWRNCDASSASTRCSRRTVWH